MQRKIRYWPDPVLKLACSPVVNFDVNLEQLLDDMAILMKESKGMGLSANQVGEPLRVMIMSPKQEDGSLGPIVEMINPKLLSRSLEFADMHEGCLSSPNMYYRVRDRALEITVEYLNRKGETIVETYTGINAVCVQHEYDHLNGIFFIEKLNRQNRREAERRWEKERKKLGV